MALTKKIGNYRPSRILVSKNVIVYSVKFCEVLLFVVIEIGNDNHLLKVCNVQKNIRIEHCSVIHEFFFKEKNS